MKKMQTTLCKHDDSSVTPFVFISTFGLIIDTQLEYMIGYLLSCIVWYSGKHYWSYWGTCRRRFQGGSSSSGNQASLQNPSFLLPSELALVCYLIVQWTSCSAMLIKPVCLLQVTDKVVDVCFGVSRLQSK